MSRIKVRALNTIKRDKVYHVPGTKTAVFVCDKEEFDRLNGQGFIALLEILPDEDDGDEGQEDGAPGANVLEDPKDEEAIPGGFPFEKKLRAGGLTTLEAIRSFPDLTKISGIGAPSAATIKAKLAELDAQAESVEED